MKQLEEIIKQVSNKNKRNLFTFLTGAGISSESGIPTYRGVDGIWVKGTQFHKPEEFGTFKYFKENPEEVWQYSLFRKKMFENAIPNTSHYELVEIERILKDRFQLITQNIDNLHRRSGTERIFEIHGNNREIKCSNGCKEIVNLPEEIKGKDITEDLTERDIELLKCKNCGSWMRPNILWFDEYYDEQTHKRFSALKIAKNSGILFIIGTSGATNLPVSITETTLKYGGTIVDINIEDNQFTALIKDKKNKIIIRQTATEALKIIKEIIKNIYLPTSKDKYQIILCEKATGIVLELDGKTRYQAIEENMYPTFSFDTLQEAEEKANNLLKINIDLEITINSNGEFIKRIVR